MNKLFKFLLLSFMATLLFGSCNLFEENQFPSKLVKGAYIINYGNFGAGGAGITKFDYETNEINNSYFGAQNDGLELVSNIQYVYAYKDSIYLVGNVKDQLITVNPLFQQTRNGVTEKLANPRYCVGNGDYLYVSCWGAAPDYSIMADSYIAVYNTITSKVEKTISLPGGPEGLAISRGKLYVAMNYIDSIAVLNLSNEAVSYIAAPAVSSYFIEDGNKNLYVTLVSTWSDFSTETGLGFINTSTDKLEEIFKVDGISNEYGSIAVTNEDHSSIYVLKTAYDENWKLSGTITVFDPKAKSFSTLVDSISGPKGISFNKATNQLYLFKAESVVEGGTMAIYNTDGTFIKDYATGISPYMALFLE